MILTSLAIFIFSQFLAAFIVEIILALVHSHNPPGLDQTVAGQFGYIVLAESLAIYIVVRLVRKRGLNLSVIGLGRRPSGSDVLKAAIGFAVFYAILIAVGIIITNLSPDINNQKQDLGFKDLSTSTDHALAFIALVIVPPLGEETLIRGYLYSGLRRAWRFWPAVLVTSLLFGAAHLEFGSGNPLVWAAAIDTFLLSIVLCFLRERTGAIYAGILIHMLNNFIAFGNSFK